MKTKWFRNHVDLYFETRHCSEVYFNKYVSYFSINLQCYSAKFSWFLSIPFSPLIILWWGEEFLKDFLQFISIITPGQLQRNAARTLRYVLHRFEIPAPISNPSCLDLKSLSRFEISFPRFELPVPVCNLFALLWNTLSCPYF